MILRILQAFVLIGSAIALMRFASEALPFSVGPGPADRIERAILDRAGHMVLGKAGYIEPKKPDDPVIMPVFPFGVSVFVGTFGPQAWEPRILALAAVFLLAGLVVWIVGMESGNWTLAAAAGAFVLMGHGFLAVRPGIARPETIMVLLVLLAFLALRLSHGTVGTLLAAFLLAVAFFTDPLAGWFAVAAGLSLVLDQRGRLFAFSLGVGCFVGGGYIILSQALGPWFNFSLWDVPLRHLRLDPTDSIRFLGEHLIGKLGVPTLAAVLSFALPTRPWRGKGGIWMWMGIAAVVAGLVSSQSGAYGSPSLIPSAVALALLGPLCMQRITRHLSGWPGSSHLMAQSVVFAALALQFIAFLSAAA